MLFDKISVDIIRKFQWPNGGTDRYASRPSVYHIAKDLHVHPAVVKSRIAEMFQSGIITGVKFYANDSYMCWNRYYILKRSGRSLQQAIIDRFKELIFVERVLFAVLRILNPTPPYSDIVEEIGITGISIIARNDADLKNKINIISNLIKVPLEDIEAMPSSSTKLIELSGIDMTIVHEVIYQDPFRININKIAKKLEIPSRTLRRKIEHLLKEKVIYEEVFLDTSKASGMLISSFILRGDVHKWLPGILLLKSLNDRLILYKNFADFSIFVFYTENFLVLEDITEKMKNFDQDVMVTYRHSSYNNPYIDYPVK